MPKKRGKVSQSSTGVSGSSRALYTGSAVVGVLVVVLSVLLWPRLDLSLHTDTSQESAGGLSCLPLE